jgi:cob(I)alamin adenosyltransferase
MKGKGLVHIYCGDGKGKTTAAMGLALRAAGRGMKVLVLQFLKNGQTGELAALSQIDGVTVISAREGKRFFWEMSEEEKRKAYDAHMEKWMYAAKHAGRYDLMILDEAVGAYGCGLLDRESLLDFLDNKPKGLEVVLTGRNPAKELMERADYISEIKKIRHPFDRGVGARKGIEL